VDHGASYTKGRRDATLPPKAGGSAPRLHGMGSRRVGGAQASRFLSTSVDHGASYTRRRRGAACPLRLVDEPPVGAVVGVSKGSGVSKVASR